MKKFILTMFTLMCSALLPITGWAAITDCGNGDPINQICIASGNDNLNDVQALIENHLNPGVTLELDLITKSDDDGFGSFGSITLDTFKDPPDNTEAIGGTWSLISDPVDFISIQASDEFKVYDVMGAMSGDWDTIGLGNNPPAELSYISFWQNTSTAPSVPIPGVAVLFATGLVGIGLFRKKM